MRNRIRIVGSPDIRVSPAERTMPLDKNVSK
ncbi:MAG TPA: hypothetical protein [Bacteriophage sp.]|nr:MAG TPA: hypothetical protein [Bacteriophage sp.]DAR92574.1 MAG TPA: hypothetical protein [Bacteriophage sp.]DAS69016.1 MAG TPA: hypothetical protein [Bacteriophage sp.]DAV69432.1 MAG TPA: hypothetical protein [Bacteriophage sp.]